MDRIKDRREVSVRCHSGYLISQTELIDNVFSEHYALLRREVAAGRDLIAFPVNGTGLDVIVAKHCRHILTVLSEQIVERCELSLRYISRDTASELSEHHVPLLIR